MILRVLSALVSTCLPADGVCAVSPLVSHCLPMCVCGPVLEGVSAFPRPCLPLSPRWSPIVSPRMCLCWMVSTFPRSCLPLPPMVLPHVLDCVSAFPRPCLLLSSLVALLGAKLQLLGLHIVPRATPKQHIISCRKGRPNRAKKGLTWPLNL